MFIHIENSWFEAGAQQGFLVAQIKWLQRWYVIWQLRQQVRKERHELAELPEQLLKDIGVSQEDALSESKRTFDDIPAIRLERVQREFDSRY